MGTGGYRTQWGGKQNQGLPQPNRVGMGGAEDKAKQIAEFLNFIHVTMGVLQRP